VSADVDGIVVDLFAGGGGASTGLEAALDGRPVDIAINHDPTALAVHAANHPATRHLTADIWEVQPKAAVGGRRVAVLWASPDCTHFSIAKGDVPKAQNIRSLAWAVARWCRDVKPDVVFVENVGEFQKWGPLGKDGRPMRSKMGTTFERWRARLVNLGYTVDHRVLDASAYGAPTKRRRLFIIARRDGLPIVWPEPTHGAGLAPVHTAAECIDWSLDCPSIFGRKRPLAEKTDRRIALGFKRYVLEAGTAGPFLVNTRNGERVGQSPRVRSLAEPYNTVTAKGSQGALVVPYVAKVNHGRDANRSAAADAPLSTVTAGQRGHALVSAWVVKHFGGMVGHDLGRPVGTITAKDHHGFAAAHLVKLRGDPSDHGTQPDVEEPLHTVSAGGNHAGLVYAFLVKFFGTAVGQPCTDPLCTVTTRDRCGLVLVTIDGETYVVVDIGFRMLQPHELLAAQFGRFAKGYDMTAAKTKAAKVRLIGNSVCPEIAEAIVRANVPTKRRSVAA
jgi:DNA (cytosine-5)-methyltransferase 1